MINNTPDLYQGDIIFVKNLRFRDTSTVDTRLNGHPVLVLNVANIGERFYGLKISGSYNYSEGLENYYIIKPNRSNGLKKTSYIDLRYIYENECKNIPCAGQIYENEFNNIMKQLDKVQEKYKNENYEKLKKYYKE